MWRANIGSLCICTIILVSISQIADSVKAKKEKTKGSQERPAYNVSILLDSLLKEYDNTLRPDFEGPVTLIDVNMQVRSMGPISETDMSYSMDCYFRQSWVDRRLTFMGYKGALALSIEMLNKIWKPDTYVYNGKKSYLHTITTPNRFVRLFPNGRVLYSQRLTIRAACLMDLKYFPMDRQKCPLRIGSFGYTDKDVKYQWTAGRGVNIASDMKLSQFDLISTPTGNETTFVNHGVHSTLVVSFHLSRHMGDFVIQVYGPCILLVVISWVPFWLNREATSDRISLGITTVLTITYLGLEARKDLPQVPYPTALDYFVFISFAYIFLTVVQFGFVHHFTKIGSGEYYEEELEDEVCPKEFLFAMGSTNISFVQTEKEEIGESMELLTSFDHLSSSREIIGITAAVPNSTNHKPEFAPANRRLERRKSTDFMADDENKNSRKNVDKNLTTRLSERIKNLRFVKNAKIPWFLAREEKMVTKCNCKRCVFKALQTDMLNSVSRVDQISRIVFPCSYCIINLIYWNMYLETESITGQLSSE